MRNQENAIEVTGIKKSFKVYLDKGMTLKERALSIKRNKFEKRKIIKGISFDVKKGEAIGLIGHNGCGKSTTLKLLTKIIYPDEGTIEMKGRVSSLLELGAGFHPDMSGRENVYINASVFGLTRKEIDTKMKDIIEFSELEEFIDNPVRTYSSGMYMRLAFSVAINVNADILLIDEILAVGDVNFQAKCFNKMMEIKRQGTTIVLVSHSMDQIEKVCDRSIWIQDGRIKLEGNPREVHQEYLKYMGEVRKEHLTLAQVDEAEKHVELSEDANLQGEETQEQTNTDESRKLFNHRGTGEAQITEVITRNKEGKEQSTFQWGEDITFEINYKVKKKVTDAYFGLSIFRNDGQRCYGTNMNVEGMDLVSLREDGRLSITFPDIQLMAGEYFVDVCIAQGMDDMIDYVDTVGKFEIYQLSKEIGMVYLNHKWQM